MVENAKERGWDAQNRNGGNRNVSLLELISGVINKCGGKSESRTVYQTKPVQNGGVTSAASLAHYWGWNRRRRARGRYRMIHEN